MCEAMWTAREQALGGFPSRSASRPREKAGDDGIHRTQRACAHENQEQVRINVLDAPAPERVGIPAFIDIGQ